MPRMRIPGASAALVALLLIASLVGAQGLSVEESPIEDFLNQVVKATVFGGNSLISSLNPIICPGLISQDSNKYAGDPKLLVFNDRQSLNQPFKISPDDDITKELVHSAQFDPNANTVLLIHGAPDGFNESFYLGASKDTALGAELNRTYRSPPTDYRPNVIVVDWFEAGSHGTAETFANIPGVVRRLSRMLRSLVDVGAFKPELMHCIGHSYGAHVCGQAARAAFPGDRNSSTRDEAKYGRMGRITVLDPGGGCFELGIKDEATFFGVRPSDALLVDSYMTNKAFGNRLLLAKYNVQVNNGVLQQPCLTSNLKYAAAYFENKAGRAVANSTDFVSIICDHAFATRFTYPRLPAVCSYIGYACDSYENFIRGRCGQCSNAQQCYVMDFEYQRANPSVSHFTEQVANHSSHSTTGELPGSVKYEDRREYYLRTSPRPPYCKMNYRIRVELSDELDLGSFEKDQLTLQFIGSSGQVLSVMSAVDDKPATSVGLHGPWKSESQANAAFGLNSRTLTALFELDSELATSMLSKQTADQIDAAPIKDVVVNYNEKCKSNEDSALISSIHLDYLSSSDQRMKELLSVSFSREQIKVVCKQ